MSESWHQEGQSFSRTSLGNTDHIMTFEGNWPSLTLDWRRLLEPKSVELSQDVAWELDFIEMEDRLWDSIRVVLGGLNSDLVLLSEGSHLIIGPLGDSLVFNVEVLLELDQIMVLPVD